MSVWPVEALRVRACVPLLYSRVLVCDLDDVCEGVRVHKQRRRRVVRGVPYPGGVGSPTTRPAPYRSCLRLASVFSKDTRILRSKWNGNISKKYWQLFGDVRGFPRSSPRGRLGFAEGKAKCTSVFVRIRALEGPEGSQKSISKAYFLIISGN